MILQRLFRLARPAAAGPRPRRRPELEALEERLVMNNRLVVPATAPPDNVTTFASLQSALTTPGLAAGDTIQIELGSVPGGIHNADLPNIANLTIRGDPSVRAEDLPAVDINDELVLQSSQANWSLINVHAECHGGGIQLAGTNATVAACFISGVQVGINHPVIDLNQTTAAVLRDNHIDCSDSNAAGVITVEATDNDQNVIAGNTLVGRDQCLASLLVYTGAPADTNLVVGDAIVHNHFLGNTTPSDALLQLQKRFKGLDVEDNSFLSTAGGQFGIAVFATDTAATIANNEFHLTSHGGAECIRIAADGANQVTDFAILDNRFDTVGQGTGLEIVTDIHGAVLKARVEGNDFHNNQIGAIVQVEDATDIDFGGGTQDSRGGNDFRGFTTPASEAIGNGAGAILTFNFFGTASPVPIKARSNLFSVADPGTVIFDHAHDATLPTVDAGGSLTGSAAFVQSLYLQFLHRAGDLNNPQDAQVWVTLLNSGTSQATVADAVARSNEAFGIQVEQLYQRLLGRGAGASEEAGWVSVLQHGQTLESVTSQIIGSVEYQSQFMDDTAFVRSLFRNLLQREGSASDIAAWVSALPALGRAGVIQDFLKSLEFQQDVITEDYGGLLHRLSPPAAAEVNGWLATGLDALSLDVVFATSPEYQVNG
jgi:hypothetical protein